MTDIVKRLRAIIAGLIMDDGYDGPLDRPVAVTTLNRIADLLDAVPPETLAALKAGTWRAVPVEPTEEMVASGFDIHPCGPGQGKVTDCYCAMLTAAPAKPEE